METKSLLYGLIGFFIGGLLVSIAANTFDKAELQDSASMNQMVLSLEGKTGDDFDKQFISDMILHHEGAVEMAKLAEDQAGHQEIKDLSKNIISAQNQEITEMKHWQMLWDYSSSDSSMDNMKH